MSDITAAEDDQFPGGQKAPGRQEAATEHLRGQLGAPGVAATVMAYYAPVAAVAGYIPIVISYGNGLGSVYVFMLVAALLALSATGYLAMVQHARIPGAFYAYIALGLGKRVGLGAGALAMTSVLMSSVGFVIFGGLLLSSLLLEHFGISIPWWGCVAALLAVVGFCNYRNVKFSVRVLGWVVLVEVLMVMVFNAVTLGRGGATGLSAEPVTWDAFTSGSIAVGVLFAMAFFTGFESTVIYYEEARDPARTIPRATYLALISMTLLYTLTTYCLIMALGTDKAVPAATADPAGMFPTAASAMVGQVFSQLVAVIVVTSVVAALLAMFNVVTRYLYFFSVDRVLPPAFGVLHKRHRSPHRAAVTTTALVAAGDLVVLLTGLDPKTSYAIFSGAMTYGFEAIVLLVALSVLKYFRSHRDAGFSTWRVVIAPILTIIVFGSLLFLSGTRFQLLLGTPTPLTTVLFVVLGGALVGGYGLASWLATHKPQVYARIGRAKG